MLKLTELVVPTHYSECLNCQARQTQVEAVLGMLGIADSESGDENVSESTIMGVGEKLVELSFTCLPQRLQTSVMKIKSEVYMPVEVGGRYKKGKKPDQTKTLNATVPCDGRLAGNPPV